MLENNNSREKNTTILLPIGNVDLLVIYRGAAAFEQRARAHLGSAKTTGMEQQE